MSNLSAPIRPRGLRTGRVVLLAIATFLVILVATVWILPGMLDWNRYRGSIASLVAAGIGRPVQIDGNITLHLLPQPFLTATDLKVDDDGDGVIMQVHTVRLRVALGPLIAGRVDARELTMQGADLRLPWPLPAGALNRRPPAWITGLQARVEESRLQIGDFVLSGIDAALGADPETGTLSAAGATTLFNLPTRFTIRLGRPGREGAAPIDISLDGQDNLRDTGGMISGIIEADGSLGGRITARGRDLSQLLPAPAAAWRADGRISAAGGVVVADELAVEIGGSPSRGAVALRVQPDLRLDLALAAGRLDLDAWAPVLLRSAQPTRYTGIPTGIDLSAESANLAGGLLRQVRTALDIDVDGVTVREATAIIPGEAKLALHGRFPKRGKTVSFEGDARLIAPDLRAALRWLEPVAPGVIRALPATAFRTADLTAKIAADPSQMSLTDLKGTLDSASLQGGLAVRIGTRPAISFGLTLDRLLLDPFLPSATVLDNPTAAYTDMVRALAASSFDSDLKLQVREVNWRGARFGPLSFDVQSEAGHLTVRRLEATLAGLHAALSGSVGEGGRISEGRLELTTQDIGPLRPFLPAGSESVAALVNGPANLLLTAAGPLEALALRAMIELGDLRAEVQPVLNVPAHRWAGPLTMHHPGASRLLEQLGYPGTGQWLGDGSFSFIVQAAKSPGRLDLSSVELVAGGLRATGQLAIAGRAVQGKLKAEALPLPAIDPHSPDPLPLATLANFSVLLHIDADQVSVGQRPTVTDLAADVAVLNGALTIDNAQAKLGGAVIGGAVQIQPGDLPRLSLRAQIDGMALNEPLLGSMPDVQAGTLKATMRLTGEGFSPVAVTATLAGSGSVSVQNAVVTGFDLPALQAALDHPDPAKLTAILRPAMLTGSSTLPELEVPFELRGGIATIRATGRGISGGANFNGTVDLLGRTMEGRLTLLPGPDLPELPVRLSGPIANPVRTPELAAAARWLAERP